MSQHLRGVAVRVCASMMLAGGIALSAQQLPSEPQRQFGTGITGAFEGWFDGPGGGRLFLIGYLVHHARVGSVPFEGTGLLRRVYFGLLVPHIVLSAVVLPLALATIWHGWHDNRAAHRRIARWTLPLWLYVSASGVAVYWMLYRM